MTEQAKETLEIETVEAVADKGYKSRGDILNCIMSGTVSNAAFRYDKDERVCGLDHISQTITE